MSTIACWATNKSFDCAWVSYGYGSRHDLHRYWLSLEGLLILAEYDYDYTPRDIHIRGDKPRDKILMDQLGIEPEEPNGGCDIYPERYNELSDDVLMRGSAIHIDHPDGKETSHTWFHLACTISGKYPRNKYKETVIHQSCSEQFSTTEWDLPTEEVIQEINPFHSECHKNVRFREKVCDDSLDTDRKWHDKWGDLMATESDIKEMLDGWHKEAEEAHEAFKKKNIWSLL